MTTASDAGYQGGYFQGDRHALYVGWVLGAMMRAGVDARPVGDAEGNYTDQLTIELPDRVSPVVYTVTVVVPPPPEDWTFDG